MCSRLRPKTPSSTSSDTRKSCWIAFVRPLKKTADIYGTGGGNDYTVLDGDRVIGRIFLSPAAPTDRN
jgi:hypothetical protein